jgi:hypothetical protein
VPPGVPRATRYRLNGMDLEDVGTHRSLGALDLSLDIVSESEVFLRIVNRTRDLQIRLCREHRIDDHMFDRFGYRFSI